MHNERKILYICILCLPRLIYNLSTLLVLASKTRTLSLTKQNKTNAILKTSAKKAQQI